MDAPDVKGLIEFLLARLDEDRGAARQCAEMFPSPWEIADRGWRVRIYAADMPVPDLMSDDDGAMTTRSPVVMEVEPDRHIDDPAGLSERVQHIARWDPARVLAEVEAKRRIVERHHRCGSGAGYCDDGGHGWDPEDGGPGCGDLADLALPYADHPDFRPEWRDQD